MSKTGRKFTKNGIEYKISEYQTQFQNPVAKTYIGEGRSYKTVGTIFGFAGGLLIGAGLPNALSEDTFTINSIPGSPDFSKTKVSKPGWTLVGIGIGLVAVAIPVAIIGSKKVETVKDSGIYRKKTDTYKKHELVSSHIGRRSFATNFYGKIPTTYLIYVTGHSTEQMFLTYIGKSNKDLAMEIGNYF